MKIDPIDFILNLNKYLDKNFYFVSGNENSLIEKIKDTITNKFKTELNHSISKKNSFNKLDVSSVGLFQKNELFIISELGSFDESGLDVYNDESCVYVFLIPNSAKNNSFKRKIINNKNCYLLDCYSLNRETKLKIVNHHCNINNITFEKDVYWFLLDNLDDKYLFLENELNKIFLLGKKLNDLVSIKKTLAKNVSEGEKIFFNILSKNNYIVDLYREKILDQNDLNKLFYTIKNYILLIIYNDAFSDFEKNIPKYLFREKDIFIKIYKQINSAKKIKITRLIYKTEKTMRSQKELNIMVGLRFFLNLRKIITS